MIVLCKRMIRHRYVLCTCAWKVNTSTRCTRFLLPPTPHILPATSAMIQVIQVSDVAHGFYHRTVYTQPCVHTGLHATLHTLCHTHTTVTHARTDRHPVHNSVLWSGYIAFPLNQVYYNICVANNIAVPLTRCKICVANNIALPLTKCIIHVLSTTLPCHLIREYIVQIRERRRYPWWLYDRRDNNTASRSTLNTCSIPECTCA